MYYICCGSPSALLGPGGGTMLIRRFCETLHCPARSVAKVVFTVGSFKMVGSVGPSSSSIRSCKLPTMRRWPRPASTRHKQIHFSQFKMYHTSVSPLFDELPNKPGILTHSLTGCLQTAGGGRECESVKCRKRLPCRDFNEISRVVIGRTSLWFI